MATKASMKPAPKKGAVRAASPARKAAQGKMNASANRFAGKLAAGKIGPGSGTNSGTGGAG